MRLWMVFWLVIGTLAAQNRPELVVYTYDSFTAPWGAAKQVKAAFEKECECTLRFVSLPSAMTALRRIQMEGTRTQADVLLGLDTSTLEIARRTGLFAPHQVALPKLDLPVSFEDDTFVPYDYGYFAFVYDARKLKRPPDSFEALVALPKEVKIIIQDPRSTTPGMGLLLWTKAVYRDDFGRFWRRLAPHILTVAPSWSQAYALFLKGEAPIVLSYTTSPAYHRYVEDRNDIKAAIFREGHYGQIEVAAMLKSSKHPDLARKFLRFLTSETFARIVPTTNWSYPVVVPKEGLPKAFKATPRPSKMLLFSPKEAMRLRKTLVREWLGALR